MDTFFYIKLRLLHWRAYLDSFVMETRHFIKTLCKQKVKSLLLSTLVALNVKWVPRLIGFSLSRKSDTEN